MIFHSDMQRQICIHTYIYLKVRIRENLRHTNANINENKNRDPVCHRNTEIFITIPINTIILKSFFFFVDLDVYKRQASFHRLGSSSSKILKLVHQTDSQN